MASPTATISMLFATMTLCSMMVISVSKPAFHELYLDTYSQQQVKGCYIHNQTLGICFDVQEGSMKLLRTTGEEIVFYLDLGPDMSYYQVLDQGFVNRGSLRIYVPDAIPRVPHELREFMKMKQISEETPAELEAQKSYYREAVNELHYVPEIQLLERLSRALSENGTQSEILRPFHILCLNLLKISNVQIPTELRAQYDLDDETTVQHGRKKRCTSLRGDPYNNNCLGMCGPGCTCWWGVCFDCCFNRGCYEHDLCCGRDWDSDYCQEPWRYGWSCRSYGGYPRCL